MAMLGVLQGHGVHLIVFGAPVVALMGVTAVQEVRGRARHRAAQSDGEGARPVARGAAVLVAAAGLVVAAAVHAIVAPEHYREYLWYGIFFTVLTAGQVAVAVKLVVRPDRAVLLAVGVASVAVVGLWLVSRTSGLPIGPEPWRPEEIGGLDVAATAAEVLTAVACGFEWWRSGVRRQPARRAIAVPS